MKGIDSVGIAVERQHIEYMKSHLDRPTVGVAVTAVTKGVHSRMTKSFYDNTASQPNAEGDLAQPDLATRPWYARHGRELMG